MLSFFEDFVRKLKRGTREGDQVGFYKHLETMNLGRKQDHSSAYVKDEDGVLLRDVELIRERWVRWFHTLLNAKSPRLDPNSAEGLNQWPENMPLEFSPRCKLTDVIRSLANGKAVGPDGVSVELFKITLSGDSALRRRLLDIVVRIWRGGEVPQQWKDAIIAIIMVLHKKKGSERVRQLQRHLAGSARRQDTAEDHRSPPQRVLRARGDPAGGTEWFPTEPFYHRYDVCDSSVTGVGAEETNSTVRTLYRPYQTVRLCLSNPPLHSTRLFWRATEYDLDHSSIPRWHASMRAARRQGVLGVVRCGTRPSSRVRVRAPPVQQLLRRGYKRGLHVLADKGIMDALVHLRKIKGAGGRGEATAEAPVLVTSL